MVSGKLERSFQTPATAPPPLQIFGFAPDTKVCCSYFQVLKSNCENLLN